MSANDGDLIDRMAKKHSVSPAAVQVVLAALRSGGGRMAQFSHADFGGMSQWAPGMSMVGDMFNTQLKAKLDAPFSHPNPDRPSNSGDLLGNVPDRASDYGRNRTLTEAH